MLQCYNREEHTNDQTAEVRMLIVICASIFWAEWVDYCSNHIGLIG